MGEAIPEWAGWSDGEGRGSRDNTGCESESDDQGRWRCGGIDVGCSLILTQAGRERVKEYGPANAKEGGDSARQVRT